MSRHTLSVAVLAAIVAATSPASAEVTRGVIAAFRGQLVITKDELPEGKNDKDTIQKIRAAQLKELTGTTNADVTYWHFHYTAFLSRTGNTKLRMEFLKEGQLSADQGLDGVDPKTPVLVGDISINEDEGLSKGKTYNVQFVTDKHQVVAKTKLTMK
jgi:hypothetical protein